MKYRKLHPHELQELEQPFIAFLASNTVTAQDWEKMKADQAEKANGLIEIFSDLVFEETLKKIEYLERRSTYELQIFHCLPDKMQLLGLKVEGEAAVDFRKNEGAQHMLEQLKVAGEQLQMYQAEKKYGMERSMELFQLMEQGCLISDGKMYQFLENLKAE